MGARPRPRKPTARKRAIRLLKQGRSARSIAALLGVHRNTVNVWRKAAQVPVASATLDRVLAAARRLTADDRRRLLAHLTQEQSS